MAVFAADHGVHAQGVTPWPQEVTAQMVANFLAGGAVVNAFAAQAGAEVTVVDVGVAGALEPVPGLLPRKIAPGTADFTQGPAMTREQATAALTVGLEIARDLVAAGNRCLVTGDMGIANTTASAALICAFTGADPAEATGRGTGIDAATYARKVDVVCRGLALHRPDPADPVGVLAAFGGFEHAALAGFILGAAALRVPVILDGVISGAAALAAAALAPDVTAACFAGHRSVEPGHALALDHLGLEPAGRPGPAPRRGHRRPARPAPHPKRSPRPPRRRHLRLRRRHRKAITPEPPPAPPSPLAPPHLALPSPSRPGPTRPVSPAKPQSPTNLTSTTTHNPARTRAPSDPNDLRSSPALTGTMARCTGPNRYSGPSSRLRCAVRRTTAATVTNGAGVLQAQRPDGVSL